MLEGNETHPCAGVSSFNAPRPPLTSSPLLVDSLVGVSLTLIVVFVLSIIPLYVNRNEPTFFRIRPISVSAFMNLACAASMCGYLIPHAVEGFPCWLELAIHSICASLVIGIFAVRGLVFVMETQMSVALAKEQPIIFDDNASVNSSHNDRAKSSSDESLPEGPMFALRAAISLGFGITSLSTVSIHTLSQIRRHIFTIFVLIVVPPTLVLIAFLVAATPYRMGCTDCPLRYYFVLVVMVPTSVVYSLPVVRLITMGFAIQQDEQFIMKEMLWTMILSAPWIWVGYGLELGDPNLWQFNRIFSWRFFLMLGPLFYWMMSTCYPLYLNHQYKRFRKDAAAVVSRDTHSSSSSSQSDFTTLLNQNPELKKEFYQFAASRYCMESLNFVEDVQAYKRECAKGTSDSWKRTKAKKIISVYIRVGAAQEVNISFDQRKEILELNLSTINGLSLEKLFDMAFYEVVSMLSSGTWIDFGNEKKRREKRRRIGTQVANAYNPPQ